MSGLGDIDNFLDELRSILPASMVDEAEIDIMALELQGDADPDAALAFDHICAIVRAPWPLLERVEELQRLSAMKGKVTVPRAFLYPPRKGAQA